MVEEREDLVREAEAQLDKLPDGPEKAALREALGVVEAGGSLGDAMHHMAEAAEASGQKPSAQLQSSITALEIVGQMPGCDRTSFAFGMAHGIIMAVEFPEWARAFHLKQCPTEKEQAEWHREHLKIVGLTPMTMKHDPNPTGQ